MSESDHVTTAKRMYAAFAAGDRATVEDLLAPDFRFSSPPDPDLDRDGYFTRCWPGAGRRQTFAFIRTIPSGDELVVTYELTHGDGRRGRNTEVLTFSSGRIVRAEVYFGWDL